MSSASSSDETDSSLQDKESSSRNVRSTDPPTSTTSKSSRSTEVPCNNSSTQSASKQSSSSVKQSGSYVDNSQADHWDDDLDLFDGPVRKPRLPKLTQQTFLEAGSCAALSVDSKIGNKNVEGRRKSKLDFTRFMFQRVVIKLNGRRQLRGQMQGCDQYNNIVITEGQEKINGKILKIDYALVRGTSITGIESIAEPIPKEV